MPFTSHVTLLSVGPVTDAENCCVAPDATVAVVGEIVTVTLGGGGGGGSGFTVRVASADLLGSALLRAVTARTNGLFVEGAVYTPEPEITPIAALPP